jgi:hypothetical protein
LYSFGSEVGVYGYVTRKLSVSFVRFSCAASTDHLQIFYGNSITDNLDFAGIVCSLLDELCTLHNYDL